MADRAEPMGPSIQGCCQQGLGQLKLRAKGTSYPKGIKIEPKMAELQRFKGSKSYLLPTDRRTDRPTDPFVFLFVLYTFIYYVNLSPNAERLF